MKCPKCSYELQEHSSIKGFLSLKKVYTYYCINCGYETSKEFPLSHTDYHIEKEKAKKTSKKQVSVDKTYRRIK